MQQQKKMEESFFRAHREFVSNLSYSLDLLEKDMWQVDVDKDKCNGDEECVNACPAQVFEMVGGKSEPVNMDECLGCETCVEVCPEGAITVTEI